MDSTPMSLPPNTSIERTVDDVISTAGTAGIQLDPSSSRPVQLIHFGDGVSDSELQLIEMPNDLLEEMKTGNK